MKYVFTFAFLFCFGFAVAQNLNGRTITVVGDSSTLIETGAVRVHNISSQNYTVKVRRREQSLVTNSVNYFCWTICYGPSTNVSPSGLTINANDYNDSFHGYYDPAGNPGESTITYVFFNQSNANDSVWFKVKYATSGTGDTLSDPFLNLDFVSGIADNNVKASSKPYPNPSKDLVTFDLNRAEKIERVEVVNMLGVKVMQLQASELSKLVIPVNSLPEGIYFCNFLRNGSPVSTQRFTVSH